VTLIILDFFDRIMRPPTPNSIPARGKLVYTF